MCLDSYKSAFTKAVFGIKSPGKGFFLTVTNNSSSIVRKCLKDVLTCLEEPVWHLWLSREGQGLKTWLQAQGPTLGNWSNRHTKKIYRKKKNPQLQEPLEMSPQSRAYSLFFQARSWALKIITRTEKPQEKRGVWHSTSVTRSGQEVTPYWRKKIRKKRRNHRNVLHSSNLNTAGERHAVEQTKTQSCSPKNTSFNLSLINLSAPPAPKPL